MENSHPSKAGLIPADNELESFNRFTLLLVLLISTSVFASCSLSLPFTSSEQAQPSEKQIGSKENLTARSNNRLKEVPKEQVKQTLKGRDKETAEEDAQEPLSQIRIRKKIRSISVRSGPSAEEASIAALKGGETAEKIKTQGRWTKIRFQGASGKWLTGWIRNSAIEEKSAVNRIDEKSKVTRKEAGQETIRDKISPM